jgi:hypothetical protein
MNSVTKKWYQLFFPIVSLIIGVYLLLKCIYLNDIHKNMDGDGTSLYLFGMEITDKLLYRDIPVVMVTLAVIGILLIISPIIFTIIKVNSGKK